MVCNKPHVIFWFMNKLYLNYDEGCIKRSSFRLSSSGFLNVKENAIKLKLTKEFKRNYYCAIPKAYISSST